jgi:hypothetical protein
MSVECFTFGRASSDTMLHVTSYQKPSSLVSCSEAPRRTSSFTATVFPATANTSVSLLLLGCKGKEGGGTGHGHGHGHTRQSSRTPNERPHIKSRDFSARVRKGDTPKLMSRIIRPPQTSFEEFTCEYCPFSVSASDKSFYAFVALAYWCICATHRRVNYASSSSSSSMNSDYINSHHSPLPTRAYRTRHCRPWFVPKARRPTPNHSPSTSSHPHPLDHARRQRRSEHEKHSQGKKKNRGNLLWGTFPPPSLLLRWRRRAIHSKC